MDRTIGDYEQTLSDANRRLRAQGFDDFFGDLEYIEYTHRIDGVLRRGRLQVYGQAARAAWAALSDESEPSSGPVEPSRVRQLAQRIHRSAAFRAAVVRSDQAGSVPFDPTGFHIVGRISGVEGKLNQCVFVIRADIDDDDFRDWLQLLYSTRPTAEPVAAVDGGPKAGRRH